MPLLDTISEAATPALLQWRARRAMPTGLGSAELRRLGREVWRRSVVSARTTSATYLAELARVLDDLLAGKTDMATAKMLLRRKLVELGYDPATGFPGEEPVPPAEAGSLRDLSSEARLKLVLETNRRIAAGYGRMVSGNGEYARYAWPAWELVRIYDREVPRGWKERAKHLVPDPGTGWASRWKDAGGTLYGGRMIALKDSPVWLALGEGAGGYGDGLGNPFPPFAFNSGMGWDVVEREECLRLGLLTGEEVPVKTEAPLDPDDQKLEDFLAKMPEDFRKELAEELATSIREDQEFLDKAKADHKARQEEIRREREANLEKDLAEGERIRQGFLDGGNRKFNQQPN